ncbi:hypothetical protein FE257_001205 [Aspergillus nanangensis]|uniref:Methyltransferase domain-containing protein n=1 Tax=Aspergillus nanangensis TaxID=2582783 RepID=A0AAD4GPV1_ASPNN|nr:hypothetical protein FE257_001205 [Aspergillus nanangensis]
MGSRQQTPEYLLGRGLIESIRLDAQHTLFRLHNGYCLHPRVPVKDDMKIAEIGTGTAIWLFDLARQLPPTVQLDGFDISDQQFPHQSLWPSNVHLDILDSLTEAPGRLVGQYDVVHIRLWTSVIRGNDPGPLIRHASSLLKPGGYIQWDDANLEKHTVKGKAAERFEKIVQHCWQVMDIDHRWLLDLPHRVEEHGFTLLDSYEGEFAPDLIQLCTNTYLVILFGMLEVVKAGPEGKILPSISECSESLQAVYTETRYGGSFHWPPVTVFAQKK